MFASKMLASEMQASLMLEVFRGSHKKMPVLHKERASVCKKLYSEHLEKSAFAAFSREPLRYSTQIGTNVSAFSEAPPIRPPSISG